MNNQRIGQNMRNSSFQMFESRARLILEGGETNEVSPVIALEFGSEALFGVHYRVVVGGGGGMDTKLGSH